MNPRIQAKIAPAVPTRKPEDRRQARRLSPGRLTPCLIRSTASNGEIPGWLHNLSVRGAGVLSARQFAPGAVLKVLFINAAHTFALSADLCVVRSYRVVNGDYYLGGQFIQALRYDEMLPFMV